MNQLYRAVKEEIGPLDPWEFAVLRGFMIQDEWIGSRLARLYPTNPSRVNRVVNKLVQGGLISKNRSPVDQRVVHLRLTDKGERILKDLVERSEVLESRLTEGIDEDELERFLSTAYKIKGNYADMKKIEIQKSPEVPAAEVPFF